MFKRNKPGSKLKKRLVAALVLEYTLYKWQTVNLTLSFGERTAQLYIVLF
jgi:hypothetical protein